MSERKNLRRELARRFAVGFPWGAAGVYLVFLIGNLFSVPVPSGGAVRVTSEALSIRWGSPVTAALVQFLWSGLLGAVLAAAGLPFLAERRTLLWSGVHFLLTACVFSLAGWRCGWFLFLDTWLCLLGLLLLCYVLIWAVRWIGWRQDLRLLRRSAGLPPEGMRGNLHKDDASNLDASPIDGGSCPKDIPAEPGGMPEKDAPDLEVSPTDGGLDENAAQNSDISPKDSRPPEKNAEDLEVPPKNRRAVWERQAAAYLLLAAGVELLLPWLLRALDPADVPVLTGLFYPFLILPLFAFISAHAVGRRFRWPWVLLYAAACGVLTVPNVFLLYNYTALFQAWTAGVAALLGGLLGLLRRKFVR